MLDEQRCDHSDVDVDDSMRTQVEESIIIDGVEPTIDTTVNIDDGIGREKETMEKCSNHVIIEEDIDDDDSDDDDGDHKHIPEHSSTTSNTENVVIDNNNDDDVVLESVKTGEEGDGRDQQQPDAHSQQQNASNDNATTATQTTQSVAEERFNYAALGAGAVIMTSNPESRGLSNMLVKDRDKYAISAVSQGSFWFVMGMSEEILFDTFVMVNHERYVSRARDIEISGSHRFPTAEWHSIQKVRAENIYGKQQFAIDQPEWVRYLKFNVSSFYGDEFYCAISEIRVYGSSMIEDLRDDMEQSKHEIQEFKQSIENAYIVSQDTADGINPKQRKLAAMPSEEDPADRKESGFVHGANKSNENSSASEDIFKSNEHWRWQTIIDQYLSIDFESNMEENENFLETEDTSSQNSPRRPSYFSMKAPKQLRPPSSWITALYVTRLSSCPLGYVLIETNLIPSQVQRASVSQQLQQAYICYKKASMAPNTMISSTPKNTVVVEITLEKPEGNEPDCPEGFVSGSWNLAASLNNAHRQHNSAWTSGQTSAFDRLFLCYRSINGLRRDAIEDIQVLNEPSSSCQQKVDALGVYMCVNSFPSPSFLSSSVSLQRQSANNETLEFKYPDAPDQDRAASGANMNGHKPRQQSVESIFKTLSQKIKELAIEQTIFNRYLHSMNQAYANIIGNFTKALRQSNSDIRDMGAQLDFMESMMTSYENRIQNIENNVAQRVKRLENVLVWIFLGLTALVVLLVTIVIVIWFSCRRTESDKVK